MISGLVLMALALVVQGLNCPPQFCTQPLPCSASLTPYLCISGGAQGGCSASDWASDACNSSCDVRTCMFTCSDKCSDTVCSQPTIPCSAAAKWMCVTGANNGSCSGDSKFWPSTSTCSSCCDVTSCPGTNGGPAAGPGPQPPAPTKPKRNTSIWETVPEAKHCTSANNTAMRPDGRATPYGGMDVSNQGCTPWVSESCCGYTPRFNWILAKCHDDPAKRQTMACHHKGAVNSAMDINYIAAYQWNGSVWIKDPTSSLDDPSKLDELYIGGGWPQDWDQKYAPTTKATKTQGLGPPGMLVVLSANKFAWTTLYMLNQITLNRGPGSEVMPDNCWTSSAGELDFIEPPFWDGVRIPYNRLYTTVTADAGRCMPVQKTIPRRYSQNCSTEFCCEPCQCPMGMVCFGDPNDVGYSAMGCINASEVHTLPKGTTLFYAGDNVSSCGYYFGGVAGGADSTAYFEVPTYDLPFIYASVVDGTGTTVYRWPANNDTIASKYWPGINLKSSSTILFDSRPTHSVGLHAPCSNDTVGEICAVHSPACIGDCPLTAASGSFGLDQVGGGYAAETAKINRNWWNLFDDTKQLPNIHFSDLPKNSPVPHFIPPLPFTCGPCNATICNRSTNCPMDHQYECTLGDGYGGCSSDPRFWPLSGHCGACCDVSACKFNCTDCPSNICSEPDRCPIESPYECTSGVSAGACNNNASFWGVTSACKSCCNTQSCIHPCTPCNETICNNSAHCDQYSPYQCIDGADAGGCSDDPMLWPTSPGCTSCCSTANCTSRVKKSTSSTPSFSWASNIAIIATVSVLVVIVMKAVFS